MVYLKEVPFMKKFMGIFVSVLSILMLLSGSLIIGLIFMIVGLGLIAKEGSEINLTDKTYRELNSIFGIRFGKWKSCPEFEYVSVFKTRESQTVNMLSVPATYQSEVILLNLFYNRNKHMTFYKTDNKEDAFKKADHFKMAFDIDVLDATESDKKWL